MIGYDVSDCEVALAEELHERLRSIGYDDGQVRQRRDNHPGISAEVAEAGRAVGTPAFRTMARHRFVPLVELRNNKVCAAALPKIVEIAAAGCTS